MSQHELWQNLHPPIRQRADIETVVGDEELAMRVNAGERAGHDVEGMDAGPPGVEPAYDGLRFEFEGA